jgi:hypothetical protein
MVQVLSGQGTAQAAQGEQAAERSAGVLLPGEQEEDKGTSSCHAVYRSLRAEHAVVAASTLPWSGVAQGPVAADVVGTVLVG